MARAFVLRFVLHDPRRGRLHAGDEVVLRTAQSITISGAADAAVCVFGVERQRHVLATSDDGATLTLQSLDRDERLAVGDERTFPLPLAPPSAHDEDDEPAHPAHAGPALSVRVERAVDVEAHAILPRGVVRRTRAVVSAIFAFAGARTLTLLAHASGDLDVLARCDEGPDEPVAYVRLAEDDVRRLVLRLANVASLGAEVGRGSSLLAVRCNDAMTTLAFDAAPADRGAPSRWTTAEAARVTAEPLVTLLRATLDRDAAALDAWRARLPPLPVTIALHGEHGALLLRFHQSNAHDPDAGARDAWIAVWADGTVEHTEHGIVRGATRLEASAAAAFHAAVIAADLRDDVEEGPTLQRVQWTSGGALREATLVFEIDHGARRGGPTAARAEAVLAELAALFRRTCSPGSPRRSP